jgi:hypothetical protein
MMGHQSPPKDVESAKDVPVKVAINYLEALERAPRSTQSTISAQRLAECEGRAGGGRATQCLAAEHARRVAEAALEGLKARVATEQARLDDLSTEVSAAQQNLTAAHQGQSGQP